MEKIEKIEKSNEKKVFFRRNSPKSEIFFSDGNRLKSYR
jgi:hypothetical protein